MSEVPNRLWCGPQRPINPNAEQERQERANDLTLIEAARNHQPSPEMLKELKKYERRLPKGMLP